MNPRDFSNGGDPSKPLTGIARIKRAVLSSLDGLKSSFVNEEAFRQETILALILIPIALLLPASAIGKAMMIASVILVLIVELLNTAVEEAVDRISFDLHPLAKRAKDAGSAAVMLALVNAVVVWILVLM